ncbi:glycosyltransferase [Azohydromonas australica]|uniref:glycosyltransferase n=1 Tax=Azohydromonas australica TaxID=364039 RepID=UPI003F8913D9
MVHEGVDTRLVRPDAKAEFEWGGLKLRHGDPVVTYVARNLEPYRGFHVFMRSLPALQACAPEARVVMVGGDDVSYGQRLPEGQSYRARLQSELGERVDWSRVHFTGKLPYAQYLKLLQVSAVHTYLTYPFVLSWSMLEAMASGCAVVGSNTTPVREVIEHGRNGWLTDFFDTEALAQQVAQVLRGGAEVQAAREAARATVVQRYDLLTRCLPDGLKLLERVAARGQAV